MASKRNAPAAPAAAGPATKGLRVQALRPAGIRRAGRHFGIDAVVIPLSELTDDQVDAINEEPLLAATEVDIEAGAQ